MICDDGFDHLVTPDYYRLSFLVTLPSRCSIPRRKNANKPRLNLHDGCPSFSWDRDKNFNTLNSSAENLSKTLTLYKGQLPSSYEQNLAASWNSFNSVSSSKVAIRPERDLTDKSGPSFPLSAASVFSNVILRCYWADSGCGGSSFFGRSEIREIHSRKIIVLSFSSSHFFSSVVKASWRYTSFCEVISPWAAWDCRANSFIPIRRLGDHSTK